MRLSTSSLILKSIFSFSGVKNSQIGVRILGDFVFTIGNPGISESESISLIFDGIMNLYSSSSSSNIHFGEILGISLINHCGVFGIGRESSKKILGDLDFAIESSFQ